MIAETVTYLVIIDLCWRVGRPMQHLHAVASGAGSDDVKNFSGAAMGADFQARQVTYFARDGAGIGLAGAHLANTLASAVVNIKLAVVFRLFTHHGADLLQLVTQIPGQ
ncbi:hypothetical protein D3C84_975830 [compost metagenome]